MPIPMPYSSRRKVDERENHHRNVDSQDTDREDMVRYIPWEKVEIDTAIVTLKNPESDPKDRKSYNYTRTQT